MRKTKRLLLINLSVLIISTIIGLAFLELALSVSHIVSYSSLPEDYRRSDLIRNHAFINNSYGRFVTEEWTTDYYINNIGLRDRNISLNKSGYRILMLGDSFTEGYGVQVNDSLPKQLETQLRAKGYNVEVINAGIIANSPTLEYLYLRDEGLRLKPDLVILNLDETDMSDDYCFQKDAVYDSDGTLLAVPGKKVESPYTIMDTVSNFCYRNKIDVCILGGRLLLRMTGYFDKRARNYLQPYTLCKDNFLFTRFNLNASVLSAYNITYRYVLSIKNLSEEHNISFALVTYPYPNQVNGDEWKVGRAVMQLDDYPVYSLDFFSRIESFARENNIYYIPTYYKFNSTREFPLFYANDPHMRPGGYTLMAEAIMDKLLSDSKYKGEMEKSQKTRH